MPLATFDPADPDIAPRFSFQETYDHVSLRLVAQGRPSYRVQPEDAPSFSKRHYGCLYRGDNGDRCAAGHCFEAPEGVGVQEGVSVYSFTIRNLITSAGHDMAIVGRLQHAHDSAANDVVILNCGWQGWLERWAVNMRKIAVEFNLSTKVLDVALAARAA